MCYNIVSRGGKIELKERKGGRSMNEIDQALKRNHNKSNDSEASMFIQELNYLSVSLEVWFDVVLYILSNIRTNN